MRGRRATAKDTLVPLYIDRHYDPTKRSVVPEAILIPLLEPKDGMNAALYWKTDSGVWEVTTEYSPSAWAMRVVRP